MKSTYYEIPLKKHVLNFTHEDNKNSFLEFLIDMNNINNIFTTSNYEKPL